MDEGFTLNVILAIAIYVCLFFLAEPLAVHGFKAFKSPTLPAFLRVLSLHVLLAPFMAVPLALLDRNLSMGKQSAIHVSTAIFQSGLVLVLAIAGLGYWSLAIGSLARRFVEVLCYIVGSGWRPRLAPLSYRVRGLVKFGIHISLGTFLWYLYSNLDYAFVARFAGEIQVGFYALAFQLISLPAEKITANINKLAYPMFCRLQNDPVRLHDWFVRLLVLVGFIGMPVIVGMALAAPDGLVIVSGDKWADAVLPFQILSLSGLFRIYSGMFPMVFNAMGRPDLNFKMSLVCVLVFPVCYYVGGHLGFDQGGQEGAMLGICLVWMLCFPIVALGLIHLTAPRHQRRSQGVVLVAVRGGGDHLIHGVRCVDRAMEAPRNAAPHASPIGYRHRCDRLRRPHVTLLPKDCAGRFVGFLARTQGPTMTLTPSRSKVALARLR